MSRWWRYLLAFNRAVVFTVTDDAFRHLPAHVS
jgi:hypothetical protein